MLIVETINGETINEQVVNILEDVRLELLTGEPSNKSGIDCTSAEKLRLLGLILEGLDLKMAAQLKGPLTEAMFEELIALWERQLKGMALTYRGEEDEAQKSAMFFKILLKQSMIEDLRLMVHEHILRDAEYLNAKA